MNINDLNKEVGGWQAVGQGQYYHSTHSWANEKEAQKAVDLVTTAIGGMGSVEMKKVQGRIKLAISYDTHESLVQKFERPALQMKTSAAAKEREKTEGELKAASAAKEPAKPKKAEEGELKKKDEVSDEQMKQVRKKLNGWGHDVRTSTAKNQKYVLGEDVLGDDFLSPTGNYGVTKEGENFKITKYLTHTLHGATREQLLAIDERNTITINKKTFFQMLNDNS